MSDGLILLLLVLAVYRAAHMVVFEDGPFEVFTELRSWAVARFTNKSWIVKGLNCPLCTSFWLSLPAAVVGAMLMPLPPLLWGVLWFGVAGATLVLDYLIGVLERNGKR